MPIPYDSFPCEDGQPSQDDRESAAIFASLVAPTLRGGKPVCDIPHRCA